MSVAHLQNLGVRLVWGDAEGVHVLVPPGVFISHVCGRRVRRHSPRQRVRAMARAMVCGLGGLLVIGSI